MKKSQNITVFARIFTDLKNIKTSELLKAVKGMDATDTLDYVSGLLTFCLENSKYGAAKKVYDTVRMWKTTKAHLKHSDRYLAIKLVNAKCMEETAGGMQLKNKKDELGFTIIESFTIKLVKFDEDESVSANNPPANVITFQRSGEDKCTPSQKDDKLIKAIKADTNFVLMKYSALENMRLYYYYLTKDQAMLGLISELIVKNLNDGENFPSLPKALANHYENEIFPHLRDVAIKQQQDWGALD